VTFSNATDFTEGASAPTGIASTSGRLPKRELLYWDFDKRRLLPQSNSSTVRGRDPERDSALPTTRLTRRELWAKYGCPMHFLSLDFLDMSTEVEFQKDASRRTKRWVTYGLGASAIFYAILLATRLIRPNSPDPDREETRWYYINDTLCSACLYAVQFCQIKYDRAFIMRNFQEMLFVWGIIHVTVAAFWARLIHLPDVEDGIASMIVSIFVVFRMRFLYFLYFSIFVCVVYVTLVMIGNDGEGRSILVLCIGMSIISYSLEVLNRKDFIQAITVWRESGRSDHLLHNILPAPIVKQLKGQSYLPKEQQGAIAQSYSMATVLFADVVSFTTMSAQIDPPTLVELLNRMFRTIDQLADANKAEKVKTIGDCYMAAAGLPLQNPTHAQTMARFGLQMLSVLGKGALVNPANGEPIKVRVGIHSGPCVAGVIGHKKFAYDIWGDAVNTAARMESHGEPMKLHCSVDTYELLKDDFECEAREPMKVKGKGLMQTYFVLSEKETAKRKSFMLVDGQIEGDTSFDSFEGDTSFDPIL
jgi:class 3 adenylate cyclase